MLLPEELSLSVGNLRLTVTRIILILVSPYLCVRLAIMMRRPDFRLALSDVYVPLAGLWMLVSVGVMQGAEMATSAGIQTLEFSITYLATRALVRRDDDVLVVIRASCICTSIVGLLSLLDSMSGSFVVHDWFGAFTGYVRLAQMDFRFGHLRASGTLEHPILLGTVCTLAILLSGAMQPWMRWPVRLCCLLGLTLSVSAGPIGGLLLGLALMAYGRMLRWIRQKWRLLGAAVGTAILLQVLVSRNPVGPLTDLTFDPASAYYRTLIWHYGTMSVMQSPIFGIGLYTEWYREEWMSKSVDAFWLMSAMNFGIPGVILIALGWISPCLWPAKRTYKDPTLPVPQSHLRLVLNIAMVVIVYIGFTVHLWGPTAMLISIYAALRAQLGAAPDDRILNDPTVPVVGPVKPCRVVLN